MILCVVELYDNNLGRKSQFQTGAGDFIRCEFTHGESGCLDFILEFAKPQDIEESDIIKIRLHESTEYFFTGVIRKWPISGSSKTEYIYTGYGFNDYLTRLNSQTQTYANKTINEIITHLVDNIIVPSSPITKDAAKIDPPNITITSYNTEGAQIPDVLRAMQGVANSEGDYIYGIDREGELFFKERSSTLMTTLTMGGRGIYGIPYYEPEYINTPVSKVYLYDKDGVYLNSFTSSEDIDINEIKLVAPDIDNTSAEKWAQGYLAQNEVRQKSASIEWGIETNSPLLLTADGTIRVISSIPPPKNRKREDDQNFGDDDFGAGYFGGPPYLGYNLDDTLQIKQVKYIISATEATRQIELGTIPVSLDEQIMEVEKKLTDLKISLGR